MQKGAVMSVVGRFSSDSRMIKLSDNQQTIEILDPNSKKLKDSFSLKSMDTIVSGKTTRIFFEVVIMIYVRKSINQKYWIPLMLSLCWERRKMNY